VNGLESINAEDFISEIEASQSCGIMLPKAMQQIFLNFLPFFKEKTTRKIQ
jgi:hypothetical protein